jgi:hypothetical protein
MGEWRLAPPFFTSALDASEWSASRPDPFTCGEKAPGVHWIGGWVGLTAGLDATENKKLTLLPGIEPGPSSSQPFAIPTELL